MKATIQNRAARCITSALLGSALSDKELDEIADEFLHGGDLLRQIGQTITEFVAFNKSSSSGSKTERPEDSSKSTGNSLIDEALAIIKKRRLSKANILHKIGSMDPGLANHFTDRTEISVEGILNELPLSSVSALLELLRARTTKEDEYLSGIMRERR
jgi:hypothetical protein